ncbi:hypothetical protein MBLNU230_g7091t1 [Neophaeotheca triangularis]
MAEHSNGKFDPHAHLLLDQSMIKLPQELLRKNLKDAQRAVEVANKGIMASLTSDGEQTPEESLAAISSALAKAKTLQAKIVALKEKENELHRKQKARLDHLQGLFDVQSVDDVKYERWAATRLDRLLVDYMMRQGYTDSAKALAKEKGIEDLVDIPVFAEFDRISNSLKEGRMGECLAWCSENKQALRKIDSKLELELRLQECIEMARAGETLKLIAHARKYLTSDTTLEYGMQAAGLLAHDADTPVGMYRVRIPTLLRHIHMGFRENYSGSAGPDGNILSFHSELCRMDRAKYKKMLTNSHQIQALYHAKRYDDLAQFFLINAQQLLSLPEQPLLYTALSAGLSALKTPACHSSHNKTNTSSTINGGICPICSTELNELAESVPYAHHTKSFIEEDPVVLPNGRVMGRQRLKELNEKMGVKEGFVRDPTAVDTGENGQAMGVEWEETVLKKVYIS